jgi:hypothetical protein
MSPGVPLLTRTAPATAQKSGAGFSHIRPALLDARCRGGPYSPPGSPYRGEIVLLRDFLDGKRVAKRSEL